MSNASTTSPTGLRWALSGFGDEIDDDPAIQVAVLQSLGASHIEVRSAWGVNIVEMTDEQHAQLAELFRRTGMQVSAIASPLGKVDVDLPVQHELDRLERAIAAATTLGARYIRIFSFYYPGRTPEQVRDAVMERLSAMAQAAAAAGVVLLHENEKEIFGDIPARVHDILATVDSPALRMAWDAANYVQCGVRPYDEAWDLLHPWMEYLQVKDATLSDAAVTPAGEGDGQVRETIAALAADGYDGFASLEPHLTGAFGLGGFSGPAAFGLAARAFRGLTDEAGVTLV